MLNITLMRKPVPHFAPSWHDHYTIQYKSYIATCIDYTDYCTFIHDLNPIPSYCIMLALCLMHVFNKLLCLKLCWYNWPEPIIAVLLIFYNTYMHSQLASYMITALSYDQLYYAVIIFALC